MDEIRNAFNGMLASFKDRGALMVLLVFGALLVLALKVFKIRLWKPKFVRRARTRVVTRWKNRRYFRRRR